MTDDAADDGSAGALLRAAREKQGLHVAALAAAIKVSPRKLEALEAGRSEELPDTTFTRALAQAVCRQLKIDARPVLERLPPVPVVALDPSSGRLNAPFRERPGREESGRQGAGLRPTLWAAAALASAAAAVWLVPADLFGWRLPFTSSRPGAPEAPALPASAVNSAPPGFAGSAAEVASAPAWSALPAAPADVADSAVPAASTAREASSPAPMAAPAEVMAANPAASVPAGTPSSPVQLRSTESSWIEVRDGQGKLLVSRTLLAGENLGFDGQLPLRLTIGNAAATRLGFRGQPVDLAPLTRENVARVELR